MGELDWLAIGGDEWDFEADEPMLSAAESERAPRALAEEYV